MNTLVNAKTFQVINDIHHWEEELLSAKKRGDSQSIVRIQDTINFLHKEADRLESLEVDDIIVHEEDLAWA